MTNPLSRSASQNNGSCFFCPHGFHGVNKNSRPLYKVFLSTKADISLEKSIRSRKNMQALGAPGKTGKTLITRKATENRSCVFCIHAILAITRIFSVSRQLLLRCSNYALPWTRPCTPMTCREAQIQRLQDTIELRSYMPFPRPTDVSRTIIQLSIFFGLTLLVTGCGNGSNVSAEKSNPDGNARSREEKAPHQIVISSDYDKRQTPASENSTDHSTPPPKSDSSRVNKIRPSHIYYVDKKRPNANDNNPGTESSPFLSIQSALNNVKPGEAVYIKAGEYPGPINIQVSGTPNDPISIQAAPGHERKVIITGDGINIKGQSHVNVHGFKIKNSHNIGIYLEGPSTGVTISGNHTYNTVSSGISAWGVPWGKDPNVHNFEAIKDLIIKNNKIELANNGGWNEQITLASGVSGFEISYNEITTGGNPVNGGEGIDIKEGCSNGEIHHNNIHDINRLGIYIDGGGLQNYTTPATQNIKIYSNTIRNVVGEGISLSTEGRADIKNIQVYDNQVKGATKNGIVLYKHPAGAGTARDINIFNNKTYENGSASDHDGGGIRIDFPGAKNVVVRDNTAYLNKDFQISIASGSNAQLDSNLTQKQHD